MYCVVLNKNLDVIKSILVMKHSFLCHILV